jgi:hypothetical protein
MNNLYDYKKLSLSFLSLMLTRFAQCALKICWESLNWIGKVKHALTFNGSKCGSLHMYIFDNFVY